MPEYFQRPENALKRANEFLDVDKKKLALDVLSDVLGSKKHRTWQKIHESIISVYLTLCVELKKSQQAKEGLYQYKIICQQVNIKSLEDAVRNYLKLAEEKTQEARELSTETAEKLVEDLDMIQSPEDVLLSAVTGEKTQDRTNRLMLTPWVKFLWESYRQCLDLLRNNTRVEKLYHDIAQQAFQFCIKYERRTEFRKLCDNLRNHMKLSEQRQTAVSINLSNPESQLLHLETRIAQLDCAIHIELWQEAFKVVEDIHYLMSLSKRTIKPQMLEKFHSKLSLVFWKAGNMLFHACSRHHMFRLHKEMKKNPTKDDLSRMASLMLVSTLAIPITEQKHGIGKMLDMESALIEKHLRLAKLLGLSHPPTRANLIKDLLKINILVFVPKQLQNLYQWLEVDFHPLKLSSRIMTCLQWIQDQTREPELNQYIPALEGIVISRVMQQVSKVYQTIEFPHLRKLLPFCSAFDLERAIIDAARNGQIQVRIDHNTNSLSFGTDLNASPLYVEDEFFEVERLQPLPSEEISEQFNAMALALHKANELLQPLNKNEEIIKKKTAVLTLYQKTWRKDHEYILQRKQVIENRKEQLEQVSLEKEMKEQKAQQEQEEAAKTAETKRLEKEMQEREEARRKEEREEEQLKVAQDRLEMIRKSELGAKMLKDIDVEEFSKINTDELLKRQMETMEREKRERQEKLKQQEKKVDYFIRAKRLVEIPLLQEKATRHTDESKQLWDKMEEDRINALQLDHSNSFKTKLRLDRMIDDHDNFVQTLLAGRQSVYEQSMEEYKKIFAKEKNLRLAKRKAIRKEERRQRWMAEKAEEEQRRRDEELKREREEKERLKKEKEEQERIANEERMRLLNEQNAKQLAKEREIEEKIAAQQRLAESQPSDRWRDFGPRKDEGRSRAWRGPSTQDERSDNFDKRDNVDRRENYDRRDRDRGYQSRDVPRWGPGSKDYRDEPPRRNDYGSQYGEESEGNWRKDRRQSPIRRMSPPGRRGSPPGRRGSPPGKRASPPGRRSSPLGRRRSPMGRRSPPPGDQQRYRSPPRSSDRPRNRSPPRRGWSPPRNSALMDEDHGAWRDRGTPQQRESAWRRDGPPSSDARGAWRSDNRKLDDRNLQGDNRAWRRDGPQPNDGGNAWRRPNTDSPSDGGAWRKGGPPERSQNAWKRPEQTAWRARGDDRN